MPVLSLKNLLKIYSGRKVVDSVSLDVSSKGVFGLLGPNGAGKTTTFYMTIGMIKPDKGQVFLDGENITDYPMYIRARRGIGYLPQEPSVFRKLTVEQNIMAILENRKDLRMPKKKEKLDSLLQELGITHLRKQKAYTLSGGERRRTEIARSLAIEPQFLLLDEPFAGIDPIAVYEIKRIAVDLSKKGIGVLLTDHNVRDTLEITHRSYIINLGEIVVAGPKDELLESEIARRIYLGEEFRM